MQKTYFALVYIFFALISCLYFVLTLRKCKNNCEAKNLAGVFCMVILTQLSFAGYLAFSNPTHAFFSHSMAYICLDYLLLFLMAYGFVTVGKPRYARPTLNLFIVLSVIDTIALITNPLHNEIITYETIINASGNHYQYTKQFCFVFHSALCYMMLAVFFITFLIKCMQVSLLYCQKYVFIMIVIALTFTANIILLFFTKGAAADRSFLLNTIYSIILYFFSFHYRPTILTATAKKMVMDYITTPIILFNNEDILVDMSDHTLNCLPVKHSDEYFLSLASFLSRINVNADRLFENLTAGIEVTIPREAKNYYYNMTQNQLLDKRGRILGRLFVFHDISYQVEMYDKLEQLANIDSLTGLFNKHNFTNTIPMLDCQENLPLSVITCDINGLKMINNIFGEPLGDQAICFVASSLKRGVPDSAYVARLEGDETIILIPKTTEAEALALIHPLIESIERTHAFEFDLNVEFGIACKSQTDKSIQSLITTARNNMINKKLLNSRSIKSALVDSLLKTLSQSDYETEEHCERVKSLSRKIGTRMSLSDGDLTALELLAVLHDIGKLSIPSHILSKPGPLDKDEWEIMKQHTIRGYHIATTSDDLVVISQCILCHHERWDGGGYPNGLSGPAIPLLSRIISVVDSFDVMTHDRPYHKAIRPVDAITELQACSGTQFDPEVVSIFVDLMAESA